MSNFKRGDLIFLSKPYVYVLNNNQRGKRCDHCFLKNDNLKRCSQCEFLYFCDRNCQRKAWDIHKNECKCIMRASPKQPSASMRLISQIFFKIKKYGYDEPYEEIHDRKVSFRTLMSHASEIKQNGKACQQMVALIGTLKDYIGQCNIPPTEEFIEIFGKMCINTFSICDSEMQSIGSGIYLGYVKLFSKIY
ncbi:histone-lysine N-methyltransferase SMYD3-like isoform X1 [Stegodyphus dumicola]|uniref:histone-lysine N-methyltransferase SMYD3-like isoform X1 n=2 Tax=Stegodyphus dumicola TaxID=202533 RepID=UPI0015AD77B3|nr:histone-lysine N-methyltransferase SMYD3-like isoform X1 [Stegodyphus dumicola]